MRRLRSAPFSTAATVASTADDATHRFIDEMEYPEQDGQVLIPCPESLKDKL